MERNWNQGEKTERQTGQSKRFPEFRNFMASSAIYYWAIKNYRHLILSFDRSLIMGSRLEIF